MHTWPLHKAALNGRASLAAVAVMLGALYAGSTVVTPLYPLYRRKFGLSDPSITLVYATYVIGNLAAFVFGRISIRRGAGPSV